MKIGSVLKLVRTSKGLTQGDMADLLGISQNYLSLIEGNKKVPTVDTIAEFAKSLKISKDALLFASSDVPEELSENDSKEFQRLRQNILSLLLFELNGDLRESA